MRMHQTAVGDLFRNGFLDQLLMDIRNGDATIGDCYPHLLPMERGGRVVPAVQTRCGRLVPIERIAYNFDEMDCQRCLTLTMGEGDEWVRPIGDTMPHRLYRRASSGGGQRGTSERNT